MKRFAICINRKYGSGGREVGVLLSEELNIPFYDKELIQLAAKDSGLSEEVIQSEDEKHTNSLLYSLTLASYPQATHFMQHDIPVADRVFAAQSDCIKKISKQRCILIGRCSDYILKEETQVISVFIYTDKETAIKKIIRDYDIHPADAPMLYKKINKKRGDYYHFYTHQKWDDAQHYHLCINTKQIGSHGAKELIITYLKAGHLL